MEKLREQLNAARQRVQDAATAIENAADDADFGALRTALDEAIADADAAQARVDDAERIARVREQFVPISSEPTTPEERAQRADVTVGREEPVYRADGPSFFGDMFRRDFMHDHQATQRLNRHFEQALETAPERRDVGTSAFAGLVVPQYLVDLYAPLARAGRPFANQCFRQPLPASGMTVNISRITTGATEAVQATENAAVSETDMDDTLLTVNVRTIAGQQDISRQALERGENIDAVVFADLLLAYNTQLDSQILNGTNASGEHLGLLQVSGINAVTYTSTGPTVPGIWPKIADGIQQNIIDRFLPPDFILMHPRRWGWFTAALDSSNRPFVPPTYGGPENAGGVSQFVDYGDVVGQLHGLPVVTDANLPTTLGTGTSEDIMIVTRSMDNILWEEGDGTPRQARFEQTAGGNLTVKLVLYGYSAYTGGRYPGAHATIGGSGLTAPSF